MFDVYYLLQLSLDNVVFIALALAVVCFYYKQNFNLNLITVDDEKNVTCDDKECVRCNKYKVTLKHALQKLSELTNNDIAAEIKDSVIHTGRRIKYLDQKPNVFFYKCLSSVPLWDKSFFKDSAQLENSYTTIFEEFKNLPKRCSGGWNTNSTPLGSWDVFPLINQGMLVQENAMHCPETMKIVNNLPSGMRNNVFSNVMFSVVKPQTLITEHYGPTNIRIRCHIGLQTTPECMLQVADETVTWETGQCIVFDDSFLHSVEHAGTLTDEEESMLLTTRSRPSRDRAVLIVDLWYPDLTAEERNTIDTVFSPE